MSSSLAMDRQSRLPSPSIIHSPMAFSDHSWSLRRLAHEDSEKYNLRSAALAWYYDCNLPKDAARPWYGLIRVGMSADDGEDAVDPSTNRLDSVHVLPRVLVCYRIVPRW